MGMDADCTLGDYGRQGRGRGGGGQRCSEWCLGAGMSCVAGRTLARPGGHRVCGQVFSFCPDVFTFRPNVSSFRPDVSTFPTNFPQMCPLGPGMCQPRTLTGIRDGPVCPAGVGVISAVAPPWEQGEPPPAARGVPANAARLALQRPSRNLGWVARKTLTPGSSPPDRVRGRLGQAPPAPTGREGKSRRNFEDAGRCATVSQERGKRLSPRNIQGRKTTDHRGEWSLIKVTHQPQSGPGSRRPE